MEEKIYNVLYAVSDTESIFTEAKSFKTLESAKKYFAECKEEELCPENYFGEIIESEYNGDFKKFEAESNMVYQNSDTCLLLMDCNEENINVVIRISETTLND